MTEKKYSISNRAKEVTSFIVMDILARAKELEKDGKDVIHLEVGEPDFDTPTVIQEAAIEAIRHGDTHYTHAMGIIPLREAICHHYQKEYSVSIEPDQILVTSGTSPGMLLMMLAVLEPGDEVILTNPHYSCYPNFIEAVSGVPKFITTYPENGFQYTIEDINETISDKTRAIFINSPSNPTGIVMNETHLKALANFKEQIIISDEIYHGLVYEGETRSILEFTDNAFVVNGFSKLYAMTGWRLGYIVFPKRFSSVMEKLHQNFMISANSFVQVAGLAALTKAGDEIIKMREVYNQRRVYMIKRLREMGFPIHVEPTGAFYVFADARHISADSYKLAFEILESTHVGVTPGIDFGSGGEGFLRFSYASSLEKIETGLDRIEAYLRNGKYI